MTSLDLLLDSRCTCKVMYHHFKRTCSELMSIESGKTSNAGAADLVADDDASRCWCFSFSSCLCCCSPCPLVPFSSTEKLNRNKTPPSRCLGASPVTSPNIGASHAAG